MLQPFLSVCKFRVRALVLTTACSVCILTACSGSAQTIEKSSQSGVKQAKQENRPAEFSWVNSLKATNLTGVRHATFHSKSMDIDVGYCIYLPPQYLAAQSLDSAAQSLDSAAQGLDSAAQGLDSAAQSLEQKFPVVYYLHGGRPGSETKSVSLARLFHANIESGKVVPMIYVFVNGGPVSHYNMPEMKNGMGEDVFVNELIPHIDATYRTIANRSGRAIEGFSQGGRGTARIMFRHPELFCSAAPGGGGYATEKSISENNGHENEHLKFSAGYNTWDLAREYARHIQADDGTPKIPIQFHVGTKGFNYQNNLQYMEFLDSLGIEYEKVIVPDATHSAREIYEARGLEIMNFHAKNFASAGEQSSGNNAR